MANQFINSLAISDFLVGLYIPYHMYFYMDKSFAEMQFTCILRFIVPIFTCTHSICKLLTIATDRYIAIVYPLHYNRYMTKKVAWALILGGFLIALILSTMPIYWNNWYGGIPCEMEALLPSIYFYFMLMSMFGFACIVMFLVYVKIWMEAYRHARRIRRTTRLPQNVPINDNRSLQT
ncbi:7tm 1 domain containing protein, partial [Asbolus verrucosus]